jgi:hypothetical protein
MPARLLTLRLVSMFLLAASPPLRLARSDNLSRSYGQPVADLQKHACPMTCR